jgi:acetylcholinesterase
VATHLVAYSGRNDNLFVGAIAESTFFPAQQPVSALETQLNDTMNVAGCGDAADRMACLRGKSTKELQGKTNQPSPFPGETGDPLFYWTPCVDGDLLRDYPYTLYGRGEFIKVPILFGTCTNGESSLLTYS